MCGRFAFYSPAEATAALFGVTAKAPSEPRYNIAPTQDIAAIRSGEHGDKEFVMLRWGLVPFWAKDPSIGNRMINARAETVAEKPSFRAAYRRRRCIVLADGFYEWVRDGDVKTPHFVSLASGEPFAIAGLWESWHDKESGDDLQTATLITTAANAFMERLHQRMPMVLEAQRAEQWLGGDDSMIEAAVDACPPLRAWPVDRRVNSPRNEGADLIEAVGDEFRG